MLLGKKICKLRTEKKMSQGELADALDVSRQSISKWETNSSVPELDKLIKLSEIFDISLDELVLNRKSSEEPVEKELETFSAQRTQSSLAQKTVGIILLCFSAMLWLIVTFFDGIVAGLVFAAPLLSCGLICLLVRKNAGLWCAWVVYLLIDIYLRIATGINWQYVFIPYMYTGNWTLHLIIAWCLWVVFAVLTVITALRTRKTSPGSSRKDLLGAASGWAVYVITQFALIRPIFNAIVAAAYSQYYTNLFAVVCWVRGIILVAATVFTLRIIIGFCKSIRIRISSQNHSG